MGMSMVGLAESKTNHKECCLRLKGNPPVSCLSPVGAVLENTAYVGIMQSDVTKLEEPLVLEDPCPSRGMT